jgi:hypothetical protein
MSSRSNSTERQSYGEQASEGGVASAHIQTTAHAKMSRNKTELKFHGQGMKLGGTLPPIQKGELLYVYRDDSLYKNQSGNAKTEEYKKKLFSCLNGMPLNQTVSFVGISKEDAQHSNHAKYKISYTTYGIRKLRLDTIGFIRVKPFQILACRPPDATEKPLSSEHLGGKIVPIMFAIGLSDELLEQHAKAFHLQVQAIWSSEASSNYPGEDGIYSDDDTSLDIRIADIEQRMAQTYQQTPNGTPSTYLHSIMREIYNLSSCQQYTGQSCQRQIKKWSMQALFRVYTQSYFSVAMIHARKYAQTQPNALSRTQGRKNINIIGLTLGQGKTGEYIDVFVRASRLQQLQ